MMALKKICTVRHPHNGHERLYGILRSQEHKATLGIRSQEHEAILTKVVNGFNPRLFGRFLDGFLGLEWTLATEGQCGSRGHYSSLKNTEKIYLSRPTYTYRTTYFSRLKDVVEQYAQGWRKHKTTYLSRIENLEQKTFQGCKIYIFIPFKVGKYVYNN